MVQQVNSGWQSFDALPFFPRGGTESLIAAPEGLDYLAQLRDPVVAQIPELSAQFQELVLCDRRHG